VTYEHTKYGWSLTAKSIRGNAKISRILYLLTVKKDRDKLIGQWRWSQIIGKTLENIRN